MSLINDALKRAKEVQGRQPAVVHAEPPLQPVLAPPRPRLTVPWMLPALALLTLVLGIWFLMLWWRQSHAAVRAATVQPRKKIELSARATTTPAPAMVKKAASVAPLTVNTQAVSTVVSAAVTVPVPDVSKTPVADPVKTNLVSVPVGSLKTNLVEATQASTLPDALASSFRLQGIFYRISKASALINGQTLFVNDEIEGAKLLAIERQSVRLLINGRSVVLKLR